MSQPADRAEARAMLREWLGNADMFPEPDVIDAMHVLADEPAATDHRAGRVAVLVDPLALCKGCSAPRLCRDTRVQRGRHARWRGLQRLLGATPAETLHDLQLTSPIVSLQRLLGATPAETSRLRLVESGVLAKAARRHACRDPGTQEALGTVLLQRLLGATPAETVR